MATCCILGNQTEIIRLNILDKLFYVYNKYMIIMLVKSMYWDHPISIMKAGNQNKERKKKKKQTISTGENKNKLGLFCVVGKTIKGCNSYGKQ